MYLSYHSTHEARFGRFVFDSNAARIFLRYKTEQQLNNRRRECLLPTGEQEYPHHMYERAQKITMVLRNQPSPRPSGSRIEHYFNGHQKATLNVKTYKHQAHPTHTKSQEGIVGELVPPCRRYDAQRRSLTIGSVSTPAPPPKRNRPRHHYTYILNGGTGKQSLSSDMTPRARYINATPGRALLQLGINHQIIVLRTPSQRALPASSQR